MSGQPPWLSGLSQYASFRPYIRYVFAIRRGCTQRVAGKIFSEQKVRPQRLKPHAKQCGYPSGKPLRHPRAESKGEFCRSLLKLAVGWTEILPPLAAQLESGGRVYMR